MKSELTGLNAEIEQLLEKIIAQYGNQGISVISDICTDENICTDKKRVLALIDEMISLGKTELYPLKAVLLSSDNWATKEIVRINQFRDILLEGIEKGSLSPTDSIGWKWLSLISEDNDPAEFMTDLEAYYRLLWNAVENGNYDALDIMNMIWEPEQIIEED